MESAAEYLPDAQWQRCMVHFYRNVFSHVPATRVREVSHMLKAIHIKPVPKGCQRIAYRTRHRQRQREGTRCVTVSLNQSERDTLVVRGYLSEEDRDNGAAIKKAIEGVISDMAFVRWVRQNASHCGAIRRVTPLSKACPERIDFRHAV